MDKIYKSKFNDVINLLARIRSGELVANKISMENDNTSDTLIVEFENFTIKISQSGIEHTDSNKLRRLHPLFYQALHHSVKSHVYTLMKNGNITQNKAEDVLKTFTADIANIAERLSSDARLKCKNEIHLETINNAVISWLSETCGFDLSHMSRPSSLPSFMDMRAPVSGNCGNQSKFELPFNEGYFPPEPNIMLIASSYLNNQIACNQITQFVGSSLIEIIRNRMNLITTMLHQACPQPCKSAESEAKVILFVENYVQDLISEYNAKDSEKLVKQTPGDKTKLDEIKRKADEEVRECCISVLKDRLIKSFDQYLERLIKANGISTDEIPVMRTLFQNEHVLKIIDNMFIKYQDKLPQDIGKFIETVISCAATEILSKIHRVGVGVRPRIVKKAPAKRKKLYHKDKVARDSAIIDLWKKGKTKTYIVAKLHVGNSTIRSVLKNFEKSSKPPVD